MTEGRPVPVVFTEDSTLSRALGELRRATREKAARILLDLHKQQVRIFSAFKVYHHQERIYR